MQIKEKYNNSDNKAYMELLGVNFYNYMLQTKDFLDT